MNDYRLSLPLWMDRFADLLDEHLYCRRKDLVFFPDQGTGHPDLRDQWTESQWAVSCRVKDLIKAQSQSETILNHERCIIDQYLKQNGKCL